MEPSTHETPPSPPISGGARLVALDVLRGLTIAAMILVNNPGSWSHIYAPLRHAAWHGCTPTDLVFPFFLFMVGVSIPLALGRRVQAADGSARAAVPKVLRRGAVLFGLGLLLAGFPEYDLSRIRVMGVLQRIALCYVCASLLFLFARPKVQVIVVLICLFGYWPLLVLTPVPGIGAPDIDVAGGQHIAGWLDRAVLGDHVWRRGDYDPEGLLSTIPALATTMLGVFAGAVLRRPRGLALAASVLASCGVMLAVAGWSWGLIFPINKPLWTSSYAVFTAGLAMFALAALLCVFDLRPLSRWRARIARPLQVYGVNAITVFVGSGLLARVVGRLWKFDDGRTAQTTLYTWLQTWPEVGPLRASLLFALIWVTAWYCVLEVLYRKKWILKV